MNNAPSIQEIDMRSVILQFNPNAILCLHSALVQHRYTTYKDTAPFIFVADSQAKYGKRLNLIPNIFGNEDIEVIAGVACTTVERSICEGIHWDIQVDVLLEALADYETKVGDFSLLRKKAKEYNVSDKLEILLAELKDYYNE